MPANKTSTASIKESSSTSTYAPIPQDVIDLAVIKALGLHRVVNAEEAETGNSFEEFTFNKVLGKPGRIRLPREKAWDPASVYQELLRKNAQLSGDAAKDMTAVRQALKREPLEYRIHVARIGWQGGQKTFVFRNRVFGQRRQQPKVVPPTWLKGMYGAKLKQSGSLKEWQKRIAEPAKYSDTLILAISVSFAAPLLKIMGMQNFGINLFGKSKVGKTTALLVATSVIGIGRERDLPNWNSTNNAFLEVARAFNDLILPVNEVGLLAGKRGDAYGPIRERIYTFSEGRDRARHSSSSAATNWASSSWNGIFLSTAEYSFDEYAAFSGSARSDGEYARCMDVSATPLGSGTVFGRVPDLPETKHRSGRDKWARRQLVRLRHDCERQLGTALRPVIDHMIKSGRIYLKRFAKKRMGEFLKHCHSDTLDGALEHAGKNLALVYAGACLAIEAKVLPWTEKEVLEALGRAFSSTMDDIVSHQDALRQAQEALKTYLKEVPSKKNIEKSNRTFSLSDGPAYWERGDNGTVLFTVHASLFRKWIKNVAQQVSLVIWLRDQGFLELGDRPKAPSISKIDWAERSPRWPDGSNARAFQFRDPFNVVG